MFCNKCGAALPENAKFCESCGNPVANEEITENVQTPETVPVETEAQATVVEQEVAAAAPAAPWYKRIPDILKAKKGIVAIGAAAVVVLTVLIVLIAALSAPVGGLKMALMKPSDYYAGVAYDNLETFLDAADKNSVDLSSFKNTSKISLTATKELVSLLENAMGELDYDINDITVVLEAVTNYKNNNAQVGLSGSVNGEELASGEVVLATEQEALYGKVPVLSDSYFSMDMEDMELDMEQFTKMMNSDLQDDTLKLVKKYAKIMLDNLPEFEKDKKELTVEGVTEKLTVFSADITQQDLANMLKPVLEKLKDDEDAIRLVCQDMAEVTGEEISREDFVAGIEQALESMENVPEDGEVLVEYSVLFNSKGELVGREIEAEGTSAELHNVRNGGKQATELIIKADSMKIELAGVAKRAGRTLKNGTYTLEAAGLEIAAISLEKFDLDKPAVGELEAKFSLQITEDALEMLDAPEELGAILEALCLDMDISTEGNAAKLAIALNSEDKVLVALAIDTENGKGSNISIPGDAVEMEEYAGNMNDLEDVLEELVEKLEKAGIDKDLMEDLVQAVVFGAMGSASVY